jgi:hypothetical protein
MPPTFSYCYESNYYFFLHTSVSNALYYRRWRREQILNFPLSLSAQYADADSWLKSFLNIIYQKHRKEKTHYPQQPMGFLSQSHDTP